MLPTPTMAQEFDSPETYEAYLQTLEGMHLPLNTTPQANLLDLPGITPNLAWRIVAFRPYQTLKDLHRVPGLTPDHIDQITPYLTLKQQRHWYGHLTTRITRPTNYTNQITHLRLTQRADIQLGNHITAFMLTDRDPQEPTWADYVTAHLQITHQQGQLIIGDVRPEIGQGLLHSRQTRSSASLSTIRPRTQNRISNRNSTEYGAIRGLHLTTQKHIFTLQALYGHAHWDADISPEGQIDIRRTENHTSKTTIQRKNALTERIGTLHLLIGNAQNHIGATFQNTTFSPAPPQGISTRHFSINARAHAQHTTFFGEIAYTQNAHAILSGINWQKNTLRLHLLFRHYGPYFAPLHGAPIAAFGSPPQNEQGLFLGGTYRTTTRTRFEVSIDQHKHLVPERYPLPNKGHRFHFSMRQHIGKKSTLTITHKVRKTLYESARRENRLTLNGVHRAVRLTTWAAQTRVAHHKGFAIGSRLTLGQNRRLSLWTTTYHIPTFTARIYDYEPDVWGSGTLQTRTGNGRASGFLLAWKTAHFRIATRYSVRKTKTKRASSWAIQIEQYR